MKSAAVNFRCRLFDTLRIQAGEAFQGARLFGGGGMPTIARITESSETEILRWLLDEPQARSLLCEELAIPIGSYARTNIIEPLLEPRRRERPGDIDLLFVPEESAAIAFQAKRIPVTATGADRDHAKRHALGNLKEVVTQANSMLTLGFDLNYAMVIIVVDGVSRDLYNFASRGATTDRFSFCGARQESMARKLEATWTKPRLQRVK